MPVPFSVMVCGLLFALSFTFSVAVRVPVAFGENFTLMMQCDLAKVDGRSGTAMVLALPVLMRCSGAGGRTRCDLA